MQKNKITPVRTLKLKNTMIQPICYFIVERCLLKNQFASFPSSVKKKVCKNNYLCFYSFNIASYQFFKILESVLYISVNKI